ncbi:MAG: TIGR03915 family putative DNA repair protein [Eubacteriales bacterium]|nr:TIGR03915 family putative DNA repair protein [Eubacteriales bacterium]
MTVFICGSEPEDIFCGIYDAWMSRLGHENVRLEPAGCDRELFCRYREVKTSAEKAKKVTDSIRRKLSEQLYETVYRAALSRDPFRCDKIYRFLIYAFAAGPSVLERLQIPAVHQLFSMNRRLNREYDHMRGFTRFSQTEEGILLAKIEPENDITVLLAPHFADRMPLESWMIYDCRRRKAAVHQSGGPWVMVRADASEWEQRLHAGTDEKQYEELWRTFHRAAAIEARENLRCQQNLLPLRYRPYMTEFTQATPESV